MVLLSLTGAIWLTKLSEFFYNGLIVNYKNNFVHSLAYTNL